MTPTINRQQEGTILREESEEYTALRGKRKSIIRVRGGAYKGGNVREVSGRKE